VKITLDNEFVTEIGMDGQGNMLLLISLPAPRNKIIKEILEHFNTNAACQEQKIHISGEIRYVL